jgi:hypothetical protein
MLKNQHLVHKVRANYSSCTSRNSENICSSSSGSAHEKGKAGSKPDQTQFGCISEFDTQLKANVLFCRFFSKSHPVLDQTQQATGAVFSGLYGKLY